MGYLVSFFLLISVNLNCSCQKDLWQIMQAELLFSNETYKLCIFVNFSNKKNAVIGQKDLNISSRVLRCARSTSQSGRACIIGEFLKHLKIFDNTDFSLILFDTALVLLQKVSCTSTKKNSTTPSPGAWRIGGGVRETGEEKGGMQVLKGWEAREIRGNYVALLTISQWRSQEKRVGSPDCNVPEVGGLPPPPPVLSPSPASLTLTAQTVYNILTDCLRLFS